MFLHLPKYIDEMQYWLRCYSIICFSFVLSKNVLQKNHEEPNMLCNL